MPLQIGIQRAGAGHTVTVSLAGSLDTATAPELEKALEPLFNPSLNHLVFDLKNLKFVSSAGIRVLLSARKRLTQADASCAMVNLQPQIEKILEIIAALPGFKVFQNADELDAYLAEIQRKYSGRS